MDEPSVETRARIGDALLAACEPLCRESVDAQYARDPELLRRFGPAGYEKSLSDARYNVACLAESVSLGQPGLFLEYCRWLQGVLVAARVDPGVLEQHLRLLAGALVAHLEPGDVDYLLPTRLQPALAALGGVAP